MLGRQGALSGILLSVLGSMYSNQRVPGSWCVQQAYLLLDAVSLTQISLETSGWLCLEWNFTQSTGFYSTLEV